MDVTIATIVKNEAGRWLDKALTAWKELEPARIVAVDNGSTDSTVEILESHGCEVHSFTTPMDGNESAAREFLWNKAIEGSEWVVHLDADHVPAGDFRPHLQGNRVGFYVYDMWNADQYRDDMWWRGHTKAWWQAVRVADVKMDWTWSGRGWHSGHLPTNAGEIRPFAVIPRECAILHYAYATHDARQQHYHRYMARAEHLSDGELYHATTIIDEYPRLLELPFEPRWPLL